MAAVLLRRGTSAIDAFLIRNLISPRRSSRLFFYHSTSNYDLLSAPIRGLHTSHFRHEFRRGYAKAKKSRADDDSDKTEISPQFVSSVKSTATSQMDAAVTALSRDLSKLRTGRASAGMLDHIVVENDGVKTQLNRLAVVSVVDPKTLSVTPYDPNVLKFLENAIVSSPLGINPKNDGQRLIAAIPRVTKEHTQALCKAVSKSCEDVKQSIRRARQKALDMVKKSGSGLSKDDLKRFEKEIEELTKKFVKSTEEMCKGKEKEITQS